MASTSYTIAYAFRRWLQLPSRERRLAVTVLWVLPASSAGLALFGFYRVRRFISSIPCPAHDVLQDEPTVWRTSRIVAAVAQLLPWKTTCLPRSIALLYVLRRLGIRAELLLGARKEGDTLNAHAWVEWHGIPLDDEQHVDTYHHFDRPVISPRAAE